MKQEIEHIQHIIEKDRLQMLKDFDDWWEQQSEQAVIDIKNNHFLYSSFIFCIGTTKTIIRNETIEIKW